MAGGVDPGTDLAKTRIDQAVHLIGVGRLEEAHARIAQVLAGDPENVRALRVLARCQYLSGRPREALDAADRAAGLAPADPWAHQLRAHALLMLGRAADAVAAARQSIALTPQEPTAHLVLAEGLLRAGGTRNIVAARTAVSRARTLAPDLADVYLIEGNVFRRMAWFDRARRAYQEALRVDPENSRTLLRLAEIEADRGRVASSSHGFHTLLANAPTDTLARQAITLATRRGLSRLSDRLCLAILAGAATVEAVRGLGVLAVLAVCAGWLAGGVWYVRRWLARLSPATRNLIGHELRRFGFFAPLLTVASLLVGVTAFMLGTTIPRGSPLATPWILVPLSIIALPTLVIPLFVLVLRIRNWLIGEVYYLLRRTWFRLQRQRPAT